MDEGIELRPRPFGRYPKKGKALASEFSKQNVLGGFEYEDFIYL